MLVFDHLVHVIQGTPIEAVKRMKSLGFHVLEGGEHTNWGTWNSLSYFDLAYIEFLAVQNENKAKQADNPLVLQAIDKLMDGEGMLQIAVRTDRIEELAATFVEKGLHITGPIEGKRIRKDGHLIEWKMLFVNQEENGPRFPFFIQWEESDESRRIDLQQVGVITPHDNQVKEIQTVYYAVNNVRETTAKWKDILQVQVNPVEIHKEWNALCQSISLENMKVQFCEPKGEGLVQESLKQCGELPFAIEFKGEHERKNAYQIFGSMYIY
ncbi:VOC family protein [Bacillus sp. DX1.1]|uniref:VOC family protein n=1 Tax=unclassified Bacillus (in: firmicutes) TaxID=185979 RepID=UPI002570C390|nr:MULTISPECIES: VOC family protein [unclassified Bacillus (in: firmicutes)]MDM5155361.1 VOC family protein [Bacillus sp. DX1.1]WJE79675.1 VOC family protein [Bacillus sp. DX3.1]